jgi:hypothetical protein
LGAIQLLAAADLGDTGDQIGERLPERGEEALASGDAGPRPSRESREGDEGEDEEDDGDARPHCVRHGRTSLPGDVGSDPGGDEAVILELQCGRIG